MRKLKFWTLSFSPYHFSQSEVSGVLNYYDYMFLGFKYVLSWVMPIVGHDIQVTLTLEFN